METEYGQGFLDLVQETYEVEIPDRYRRFFETEAKSLQKKRLHLEDGFLRGVFSPVFSDPALCDLYELGEYHYIDELDMVDWGEEYGDFLPFASFYHTSGEQPSKAFLVVQISDPECPVWLWDYSWMIFPLAASLDDFVESNAWTGKEPLDHESAASTIYKKFSWLEEDETAQVND